MLMLNLIGAETRPENQAAQEVARLRVAIISDAAPDRNGVGTYYRDLTDHLKAAGVRVDLIAPRFRRGAWYGGWTFPLPGDATQKVVLPPYSLVSRRVERFRPDTIVVPTPGPYGLLGMHLAKRKGAKLIVGFHTDFERIVDLYGTGLTTRINQAYLSLTNRLLFRNSDAVLANSEHMVAVARNAGAKNVGLMGTTIPKRFLDRPLARLNSNLERVLFAGRLAREKNLEAVTDAARAHPEIQFLVAGDGPQRQWLKEQVKALANLSYVGWVKRSKLLPLIDSADALVLPSKVESFGTIALEAMARGRIVVVSRACGIVNWSPLDQGLYQIQEGESLSDTLSRIAALDPEGRAKKSQMARQAACDQHEWSLRHWLGILSGRTTVDGAHADPV